MRLPTTAVIPANGFNTRRLPVSAAIPKEFLPIGNRPAIDYLIDDLVAAGITDIYFVIHSHYRVLFENYFIEYPRLTQHLERAGKQAELKSLRSLQNRARFHLIDDDHADGRYGSAVPLTSAKAHLGEVGEFLYVAGDDFTVRKEGSDLSDLLQAFGASSRVTAAMLSTEVSDDKIKNFGILDLENVAEGLALKGIIEKPQHPEGLPRPRLATISKYVFTAAVWSYLDQLKPDNRSGEYYITDVCTAMAADGLVIVHPAQGKYYDVGTLANWQIANAELPSA